MNRAENHLIVMTRLPCEGRNKTRLIPALGVKGAAAFHNRLARHTIGRASSFCLTSHDTKLVVRLEGGTPREGRGWLGDCDCRVQGGGDLGARMCHAADEAFAEGARRIIVIGTDCPELDESILAEAFDALIRHDLVFGPACDGGYFLIGMSRPMRSVFENIAWGGPEVLAQSLAAAHAAGVHAVLLGSLPDVDTPGDLPAAETALDQDGTVSVIIPTYNEEQEIEKLLGWLGSPHEVIVADGGSTDRTLDVARGAGAKIVHAPKGRASQMNLAAANATGELLLFLHADTLPPADYQTVIARMLQLPGTSAGAFRFGMDGNLVAAPLIESLVKLRNIPYGDQGLFIRRHIFRYLGGFPYWPVMEDLHLVRQLSKLGKVRTSEAGAITSPRRWERDGVLTTFLRHQIMLAAYFAGIPPHHIAKLRL